MNTHAGALHAQSGKQQIERMAKDAGLDAEIIQTHSQDEMTEELKKLVGQGAERVAVAGGDGTVEVAVQTLAHTSTALGILSMGTFNNFAAALRIPHNLPDALKMLAEGVVLDVDLGKTKERYFTESAGVGLWADALALYGKGSKTNFFRGVYAATRLGLAFGAHETQITIDGVLHSSRVTVCEVVNTYRIAQAAPIAPEAELTDGLLDVVIFNDIKRSELGAYLRALRAQMHLSLPKVQIIQGREVTIECRRPRNVHTDDTSVGVTPMTITVAPKALKVLVDPRL